MALYRNAKKSSSMMIFLLRSFFYEKAPAKAMETAASMPPKKMTITF